MLKICCLKKVVVHRCLPVVSSCHEQLTCTGCNYPSSWILCLQHFPLWVEKRDHSHPTMAEDLQKGQRNRGGKETAWPQLMWSAFGPMRVWQGIVQHRLYVWNCETLATLRNIKLSLALNLMAFPIGIYNIILSHSRIAIRNTRSSKMNIVPDINNHLRSFDLTRSMII